MTAWGSDRLVGGMNRERATDGRSYIHNFMESTYRKDFHRHALPKTPSAAPTGGMNQDSRMFRQESTYTEDYPRWPVGDGHTRPREVTVVDAPSQSSTTYNTAYVGKRLPDRTPSAAPAYVPPSVGPLSSRTEYRDHYEQPHPPKYNDVVPVTANVGSGYHSTRTTYETDYDGPETQRKTVKCGPYPQPGSRMDLPDSRSFRTEHKEHFTGASLEYAPDNFYPNPPVIPQVFVQEHLVQFRPDQHTPRIPTTQYRPNQYQP